MRQNLPVSDKEQHYDDDSNLLSITDKSSRIKYANKEFSNIAGFELNELEGQPHNIVRHPDMPPSAFKMLWDQLKSDKAWMGLVKNRCKNGNYYWVDSYVTPITNEHTETEYQSVRVKPKKEWVKRAESLYSYLSRGVTPRHIKRRSSSIFFKLSVATLFSTMLALSISMTYSSQSLNSLLLFFLVTQFILQPIIFLICRPIAQAVDVASQVSSDPVAMHIYTGRNDDAGQILLALKMLRAETGGLIGRIADDSRRIAAQSLDLDNSVKSSQQHVANMHQQTDQVATAINEMSATIQEVATNASSAADAANDAQRAAATGSNLVSESANAVEELAAEISQSTELIAQLERDSEDINTIIDVIRSVAEQTNLLALNAAIEAARAGEHGQGFSVVADEVRTLANKTHQSTAEIMEMITRLQNGSEAAASGMKQAKSRAESTVINAQQTKNAIEKVTQSIGIINDMNQQIAVAVEEQSSVAEDINKNVNLVSKCAEELNQLTANNAETGSCLRRLSSGLQVMAHDIFVRLRESH